MPAGWPGCDFCKGSKGCPRASSNSVRCTASACKAALKARNEANKTTFNEPMAPQAAPGDDEHDEMPDGMWVHEIEEILGERCCEPHIMSHKKRKNGPGPAYHQEFLVRGTFLEDDGDADDEEEDDTPEPYTFWVEKSA